MATSDLTRNDIGKNVVNTSGGKVGIVVSVEDGVAHVDANPNISDRMKARLGLNSLSKYTFPLDPGDVSVNNRDEIRVTHGSEADKK